MEHKILSKVFDIISKRSKVHTKNIILKTKNKELIIFENSAHNPLYEEPEKFNYIMKGLIKN